MTTCNQCDEPLGGMFNCHHHNTSEHDDGMGNTVVDCDDCPAWWIITPGVPC